MKYEHNYKWNTNKTIYELFDLRDYCCCSFRGLSVPVDAVRALRLLLAQLRHVDLQAIGQNGAVLLVVDETILLQLILVVPGVGIALNASFVVVFTFVAIRVDVSICAPSDLVVEAHVSVKSNIIC